MPWTHILTAVDDSAAGLHAARTAQRLAADAGIKFSAVTVLPGGASRSVPEALAGFHPVVAYGVPGIEVVRVADDLGADLLVLGRQVHANEAGPSLGPTADHVVRRSRVPVLFVPQHQDRFRVEIVALDGTDRGYAVLDAAREFRHLAGSEVKVVTVEPVDASGDPDGSAPQRARTLGMARRLDRAALAGGQANGFPFRVLRGDPVPCLQGEIEHPETDLLAIGARRGGPGGAPQSTGIGRMLLHAVQCAVLTVPL
jgi:nucleotide-binding universal stress UspA family protein